jgi:single-strand DNA-binding protein
VNYNKSVIVGRVTQQPQLRATPNGQSVLTMSVATNRAWTDKNNKKQEAVEFHNVVVWGRLADTASKYLQKGSLVLVEGRLQTRSYEDKDGVTRKATEIVADGLQFGPKPAGEKAVAGKSSVEEAQEETIPALDEDTEDTGRDLESIFEEEEIKPEDIPF